MFVRDVACEACCVVSVLDMGVYFAYVGVLQLRCFGLVQLAVCLLDTIYQLFLCLVLRCWACFVADYIFGGPLSCGLEPCSMLYFIVVIL